MGDLAGHATALSRYAAELSRCATPDDARPLLAAPPPGVARAALDEGARVAVVTPEPVPLASAFGALGTPAEAPPVPSDRGPLRVALYPAGPPAVVATYGDPLVYAVAVRWPATGPVGDLRIDRATGSIGVARRTVTSGMSRWAADALGGTWRAMTTGHAWYDVEHEVPGAGTWFVSLSFQGDTLAGAHLAYLGPDEPRDWGSWSVERERAAAARHDAWLHTQLGRRPLLGDTRRFPWGRVWSGYDERSAGSSVVIDYTD